MVGRKKKLIERFDVPRQVLPSLNATPSSSSDCEEHNFSSCHHLVAVGRREDEGRERRGGGAKVEAGRSLSRGKKYGKVVYKGGGGLSK